jgi:hypothetical protein
MNISERYAIYGFKMGFERFKGGGGKSQPIPPPAAVPQEAEASAAKRDVEEANLRKRGRTASQKISPAVLLTAPNLNQPALKQVLG